MISKASVSTIYNCSLERAFKTPILCDITKIHTGYGFTPKVTHSTEDKNWGKPGYSKKIFAASSIINKGGWISIDKVIERVENRYWKIEVSNFQSWMFGFFKFVGEWRTTEIESNKVLIEYSYHMHSNIFIFYPFHWLFTKIFWKIYMKRVLENVRNLAYDEEPYLYV